MSDDLPKAETRLRAFLANASRAHASTDMPSGRVISLDEIVQRRGAEPALTEWGLAALRGRLVELSARGASATLTTAFELVLEAQLAGEPVAWISSTRGSFFPPDASASGIDLAALVVVRVAASVIDKAHSANVVERSTSGVFDRSDRYTNAPARERADRTAGAARAGERLLRSGAFGLLVIDLEGEDQELSMVQQGRLVTLAQTHDAAVVCLTEKSRDGASVGSLVSLRVETLRSRLGIGEHELSLRAIKDKRRGPGWEQRRKAAGPSGLR